MSDFFARFFMEVADEGQRSGADYLRKIKNFPNFIVSSGGGIIDGTPEENLRAMFDVTRRFPVYTSE